MTARSRPPNTRPKFERGGSPAPICAMRPCAMVSQPQNGAIAGSVMMIASRIKMVSSLLILNFASRNAAFEPTERHEQKHAEHGEYHDRNEQEIRTQLRRGTDNEIAQAAVGAVE